MAELTKLENLINPEVMGDMINAKLEAKIRTLPYAEVDTTLQGAEGDTITIPKFGYIGDAVDVEEGEEIPIRQLTATDEKYTVKMAAVGIELTDRAVLSAHGDTVGNGATQLANSINAKVDNDAVEALIQSKQAYISSNEIDYDGIVDTTDLFEEEVSLEKVIFVHPKQITTLRKNPDFLSKEKYDNNVMVTGEIGMIAGCRVVPSKKVKRFDTWYKLDSAGSLTVVADSGDDSSTVNLAKVLPSIPTAKVNDKVTLVSTGAYFNPIVQTQKDPESPDELPALKYFIKRATNVETERKARKRSTEVTADQIYVVALTNESKVAILKSKYTPAV